MAHWKELFSEIVATDVCCSCAACVLVCPHHVLEYDFAREKPFQTDVQRPDGCSHGDKGCDLCARACPRLDHEAGVWTWSWPGLEEMLYGRTRAPDEVFGVHRSIVLARSTDPGVVEAGQDGGIGSALVLHGLETGALEGAVVSGFDGSNQMTEPKLVTSRDEVLGTARSRYTYCATPLALRDAYEKRMRKVAMVGVSCEISAAPMMAFAGVRKWSNRVALTIGLMCSETFVPEPFLAQKLQGEHGIDLSRVEKINIKGKVIVSMDDGTDHEVSLKDCRPLARPWGCPYCPDFGAEHADISLGGLGMDGWSIVIIRTERGEKWWDELTDAGKVETRAAEEEPRVLKLLDRLAARQRRRPANVETFIADGREAPITVLDSEAKPPEEFPELLDHPVGSMPAEGLAVIAEAGPSPLGELEDA